MSTRARYWTYSEPLNPIHTLASYFSKNHFNIMLLPSCCHDYSSLRRVLMIKLPTDYLLDSSKIVIFMTLHQLQRIFSKCKRMIVIIT